MRSKVLVLMGILLTACRTGARGPAASRTAPDSFLVQVETSKGAITFNIHRDWAPLGADRFYQLLSRNFYDDARFFRVVPNFVAQFGIPASPALGRLAEPRLVDDPVRHTNARGTLVFAHAGPNTRGAQLFINLRDNPRLDAARPAGFAPFGAVVDGMGVIDSISGEYGQAPDQDSITMQGNAYLNRVYPRLDFIRSARITREWRGAAAR